MKDFSIGNEETIQACTSLLTKLAKYYFTQDAPELVSYVTPRKLLFQLYLTHQCNLRCIHCFIDAGEKQPDEMNFTSWTQIIDETTEKYGSTNFTLTGGEPLLYDDFFALANHIKDLGNTITLLTNGTLIDSQEKTDIIAKLIDNIQISLDGASKIGNDPIRGEGSFDRIVKAIRFLIKSGKKIELSMIVTPDNIEDYENNLVGFLKSFDYNNFEIRMNHQILNTGRAKKLGRRYFDFVGEAQNRVGGLLQVLQEEGCFIPPFSASPEFKLLNCGIGGSLSIDSNGEVFPCAELYYKLGSYFRDGIEFLSEKLNDILITTSVDNISECQGCDLKMVCKGGCRLENHRLTGNMCKPQCDEGKKAFFLGELANVRQ